MGVDESALIAVFKSRRDEASFRQLYRYHTPVLFAMAVRLCGSRDQGEDLTQEAWVRAVEGIATYEQRSSFRTWLTGILINCYREGVRHDSRARRVTNEATLHVTQQMPGDPIDVERALAQLPTGYKEVVLLHDISGYTHKEIAQLLGIGEGTSKSQLARGRARLREILSGMSASDDANMKRGSP